MANSSSSPKISRETLMNCIGFGLVGICFVIALGRVAISKLHEQRKDEIVIRIAHWQLENGIRDAINVLGAEYSKQHPGVKIEQLTIPERIYTNWFITQLIGQTAPDLIEIANLTGGNPTRGDTDERLARYFIPLTPYISDPNPYNQGTPLQGVPWRETMLDGMSSSYNQTLLENYAIGLNLHTIRIYYNKKLFSEVFGADAKPPTSYGEFIKMCDQIGPWGLEHKKPLTPIASSGYNWSYIATAPMQSQLQQLQFKMDTRSTLGLAAEGIMMGYLRGDWTLDTPEILNSLNIAAELGRYMTPGFMQLKREDATFYFLQQRSVFIATGSWDIKSLSSQATFPLGVFDIPVLDKNDPKYGKYILGPNSEGTNSGTPFAIARNSKHPDIALDFLKFLSSYQNNRTFSELSMWYPSVVGVEPPEEVKPFAPHTEGYPAPFFLLSLSTDTKRLTDSKLYILFGPDDPLERYLAAIKPQMKDSILSDLHRTNKLRLQNIGRFDSVLEAMAWQQDQNNPGAKRKLNELSLNQSLAEVSYYFLQRTLDSATSESNP